MAQLAALHGVHPIQITQWKKQLLAGAAAAFATGTKGDTGQAAMVPELYERIGRLDMELEFLKKNSPASAEVRRSLLEPGSRVDQRGASVRPTRPAAEHGVRHAASARPADRWAL